MTPHAVLSGGGQALALALSGSVACAALAAVTRARARTAADFLTGDRRLTGRGNGFALCGAYLSAVSLLGISGVIALSGYDGFACCVGVVVAWIPVLLLARQVRNTGRRTQADVLCRRALREPPVRVASAVATVTISACYLVAQLSVAGALAAHLLGVRPAATIALTGTLTIVCAAAGGTRGATWMQIAKTALLLSACGLMTLLTLARFGFDLNTVLGDAADASGSGAHFLAPGLRYGGQTPPPPTETLAGKFDFVSLALTLALGAAGLPQVMNRLFAGREPRASVKWAMASTGAVVAMLVVLGFGAAALIGHEELLSSPSPGLTAVPDLVRELGVRIAGTHGGDILSAIFAATVFATILTVTTSALLAAATSLAHDWFGRVFTLGRPKPAEQLLTARAATIAVGAAATALAMLPENPSALLALPFTIAASSFFPAVTLSLFWRRLNGPGVVAALYGGLTTSIVLTLFSPVVSGRTDPATGESLSLLPPGTDFAWFPLENPALISVPAAFLCAAAATCLSREKADPNAFTALTVHSLTGTSPRGR